MKLQERLALAGIVATLVFFASTAAQSAVSTTGSWSLESVNGSATFSMDWRDATGDHNGSETRQLDVHVLGIDAALASSGTHVTFAQHHESGDCTFEGWVADGKGGGTFTYIPNAAFFDDMRKRGLPATSESQEVNAMLLDVTRAYVNSIAASGANLGTFHDVIRLRAMGVDAAYVRDLAAVGFAHLDAHDYVRLKALSVDGAYIKYLQGHGLSNLTVREVVRLKAQQI